ncbi:hypothetical protein EUGRSUZ_I00247 [Eucalyptus grandis]|uniref:Uncharacterized protein n=2 Tax=Eucalyptus grandis TaxID=71139 RepID=A0ACC3JC73_EUCGR|nr:hypothetical protein EUGRSUZ_I00247 [Eucalyptus grandis]
MLRQFIQGLRLIHVAAAGNDWRIDRSNDHKSPYPQVCAFRMQSACIWIHVQPSIRRGEQDFSYMPTQSTNRFNCTHLNL